MTVTVTAASVATTTAAFCMLLKLYLKMSTGLCRSQRSMAGKTVIVTGANSGIGLETARELAKRKARVILACRSLERGEAAAVDIVASTGNCDVVVRYLDLSSLRSIRSFSEEIIDTEERLDVLIHNAGMTPPPGKHLTEDGLELQFATNHFGPFLLTHLLLDLLKQSAPSRIVIVSSVTHLWATLDVNNLNCEKYERDPYWIYCSTKLANLLFMKELSKRLQGSGVTVNALHPGGVRTSIARNAKWFVKYLIIPVLYPFLKNSREGAQTSIQLAVDEDLEEVTGKYFVDCRPSWMSPAAKNEELSRRLWDKSEIMTGLRPRSVHRPDHCSYVF